MSADMGEVTLSLVGQAWTLAVRDREGSVLSFEQGLSPTKAFSCVAQFCDTGSIGNTTPIKLFVHGKALRERWQVVDMLEAGKVHLAEYME